MNARVITSYNDKNVIPKVGDTCYGDIIGRLKTRLFVWHACETCGKTRWVPIIHGKPDKPICRRCAWKNNGDKLGIPRRRTQDGYVTVRLKRDDFFYPMAHPNGHVLEHRLFMARHLKRHLLSWEVVHHRNGIKDDNRIENLELVSSSHYHIIDTNLKVYVHKLERLIKKQKEEIQDLKDENDVLKYELNM